MRERLMQMFRLQKGEGGLVFVLGFALLANALAMQVSGIVALSGFLNSSGVNGFLVVLLVDYAFILFTGALQTLIIDKYERKTLIQWVAIIFALCFVILRLMFVFQAPEWLNYSIMYILSEQQFILFPTIFWVLANDIFQISQAKRLFPLISGFNFAGKLLGIGISLLAPNLFPKYGISFEEILTVNILVYILAFIVLWSGLNKVKVRKTVVATETFTETLREGWKFMLDIPSFKYMLYALIALGVADTLIEFQFVVVTDTVFSTQSAYQTFFSAYKLIITLVALLVQTFVTAYLLKKIQIKDTFLAFPVFALIGAIGMIFIPGAVMAVGAMAGVKLIRDTLNESGRKSFQGLIPEERRGRVSTLMESYLPSIGTIFACIVGILIIFLAQQFGFDATPFYMGLAALGALVALWAILKMRSVYDSSLLNWRLKRRQRRAQTVLLDKLTDD